MQNSIFDPYPPDASSTVTNHSDQKKKVSIYCQMFPGDQNLLLIGWRRNILRSLSLAGPGVLVRQNRLKRGQPYKDLKGENPQKKKQEV